MSTQNLIITADPLGTVISILIQNVAGEISDYGVKLGQTLNSSPSPKGRQHTSSSTTLPDTLRISGWIRPLLCNGTLLPTFGLLTLFKRQISSQKYTTDQLATIINIDGIFQNMALVDLDWRRDVKSQQEILVSMVWESMNLSGDIDNPSFSLGGVL